MLRSDALHRVDPQCVIDSYLDCLAPERRFLVERYALKDIAVKVVGVGSVGTFCAVGLFMSGDGAPLFLQIKEAGKSVLERLGPTFDGHQGRRVVEGQRVTSGTNLARVVQPNHLKAELKIAETQSKDITFGQPASVDTHNGIIQGTVMRIDPAMVFTR